MTLHQCQLYIIRCLQPLYPQSEAEWMARIIFEHLKGFNRVDLIMKADTSLSDFIVDKVNNIIDRLLRNEPIQYILGETRFYGLRLSVTPATLIPRPETEELVDMIVKEFSGRADLRVLDICTGSGCIAVTLARNLLFPTVEAIDISEEALAVARKNAEQTRTRIRFMHDDALSLRLEADAYDIIVSNPPYISESERAEMKPNVLDYEPALALFVPDDDPLRFYTAIADTARRALKSDGHLFFELNPDYAEKLASRLTSQGWLNVTLHRDMQGHYRFLSAQNTPDR